MLDSTKREPSEGGNGDCFTESGHFLPVIIRYSKQLCRAQYGSTTVVTKLLYAVTLVHCYSVRRMSLRQGARRI